MLRLLSLPITMLFQGVHGALLLVVFAARIPNLPNTSLLDDPLLAGLLPSFPPQVMPSDVGQRLPWSFPLTPGYWRQCWGATAGSTASAAGEARGGHAGGSGGDAGGSGVGGDSVAVRIMNLRKVFRTTDGMDKVGCCAE